MSTQEKLYTVDFDTNTLLLKHQVNEGEFYTSSLWVGDAGALISTNQHLYLFDQATLRDEFSTLIADHTVAYPESTLKADYAFYIPVADGYLLGFTGDDYHGFDRPGAEVFVTRLDGSFERLGGREFAIHDHPAWIRHYNFMVAPFIFASEELLMHSIDPYNDRFLSVGNLRAQTYPLQIIIMAIVLQGMSILALWLLARRDLLKTNLRRTWMGLVAVLGLPALLSYLILQPRTTRA